MKDPFMALSSWTLHLQDRLDRLVAQWPCGFCGHPRTRHRHYRAGLDCGGQCGCPRFAWRLR